MRNRLVGAFAATAIASAALVACSPPNENPSDIAVTEQDNPTHTFENRGGSSSASGTTSESADTGDYGDGAVTYQEPVAQ